MHGDTTNPAEAILTKEDYETYSATRELFTIALKGDLAKTTFLFVGFSFADPNVIYILGRVKQLLEKNSRKHYCILKAPQSNGSADGDYQEKRFSHWLTDLHRYNIQPVLIDRYEDVPEILLELNRRSHLRDIFISGSAADFAPLGEKPFHELCRSLGAELIRRNFNVISGFGLGVGDMVVVGAMQSLQRNDDERLQLRPFPQQVPAGVDRATFWRQYRERMIADAGACIVLAGNKRSAGAVVPADGVRQEVEIARAQGKAVVPIGATGHVARELWAEARANPGDFGLSPRVAAPLEVIGDAGSTVVALVDATIAILRDIDN
jgi:hypothetical protein